ncbi:nitroreductase [Kaistia dalseonensis]|uniref:Putative NAD(P)H nitroreductase n=1 Tax=Kaistia dalseonensis TaxID=410840 RepID=A0ABU0HC38_9HYPH|nr:nitroreductase [Kaistia dalseonensis]MCX5496917.1 nitroreductase [Kaistia dalseonensis]MDQ0439542.1 nitroreductase [Kaistia dalseonensis]
MTDTLDLLKTRRSIPAVNIVEPGPSDAQIEELLTIAARVPDHGKLVPWRFILFRGDSRRLAGEATAALMQRQRPDIDPKFIEFERNRFTRSPLVIAVVSRTVPDHPKIKEWEQVLSAGAVAMNLMVAANAMGFSTQWITEWVSYDPEARHILGLSDSERLAGLIHIGTRDIPPFERPRPNLADIVTDWKPVA